MAQGVLAFQYEEDGGGGGVTALGGLPVYMDLAQVMGLSESVGRHIRAREGRQGWTDAQVVLSLILLNLAGGDCVDDLRILEGDEGFCRLLRRVEFQGMRRKQRRVLERRWRKERHRSVPSPSAVFRYLSAFHDGEQEGFRRAGKALVPEANGHLGGFWKVNKDFLGFVQKRNRQLTATLDMDAVVVETSKADALYSYKHMKSYQPLNTWWAEQGMVLHTEFRDGNVPAGYEQLRVLQEALEVLPGDVERVRLRSDTAGYQHDLLRFCEGGKSERFGRIEFAIGCDVTEEFKAAVAEVPEEQWQVFYRERNGQLEDTGRQWAEVCFVPNAIGHSKKGSVYRYLATRELLKQLAFPWAQDQQSFPFPTMELGGQRHKVFGVVTNMEWEGEELIQWFYKRCGKSEEAHAVMKEDLAGGRFPSGDFGQNAAWWWIMILALNLNAAMRALVLGQSWVAKRMKAMRFSLINVPARVLERSRRLIVRLCRGHPSFGVLTEARRRIAQLVPQPSA